MVGMGSFMGHMDQGRLQCWLHSIMRREKLHPTVNTLIQMDYYHKDLMFSGTPSGYPNWSFA